jgi:hypothetical protein
VPKRIGRNGPMPFAVLGRYSTVPPPQNKATQVLHLELSPEVK